MQCQPKLEQGVLLKRYKRFLADVRLPDGKEITIHCPNTGSMKACLAEGSPCWFSTSDNKKRKYPNTWEIATTPAGHLAGVNTGRANGLVKEAIETGVIAELQGYPQLKTEVRYGDERSRIDLFLSGKDGEPDCYVEVKNVTLWEEGGQGLFPDSVSTRGTKHLRELALMVEQGHRAVLLFCVQHSGIETVSPAAEIDPVYAKTLKEVAAKGVEVYAYQADLSAEEIVLRRALPVII
ncbi:DNA/RNA nuclease SfsA [Pseudomaricurvus sp.]|uniref:DNA/RNA nuclease SfsA n=1 Tax=Pseudomaricurvus sp. TaxID=2004510 RepID=UPI003F6A6FC5